MEQPSTPLNDRIRTFASPNALAAILDNGNSATTVDQDLSTNVFDREDGKGSVAENTSDTTFVRDSGKGSVEQYQADLSETGVRFEDVPSERQEISPGSTGDYEESNTKQAETEVKKRTHIIARNKVQVSVRSKPKTYAEIHAAKLKKRENPKLQRAEAKGIRGKDDERNLSINELQGDPQEKFVEDNISGGQYSVYETESYLNAQPSLVYNDSYGSNHINSSFYDQSINLGSYNYASGRVTGDPYNFHSFGQMAPLPPIQQNQGYGIQSAPPAAYSSIRNQPLRSHFDYFNDYENVLSSTLRNSDFINSKDSYEQENSDIRRFVSEPQLSGGYSDDRDKQNISRPQQKVIYKPYTLADFKRLQEGKVDHFGRSLGPNTGSEEHREKVLKNLRQREYAEIVRAQHLNMRSNWKRDQLRSNANPNKKQAEQRRKAAINYAKTVPKPLIVKKNSNQESEKLIQCPPEKETERDLTVIELLKMRHEKEKHQVALIRKEISSKIRH